MLNRRYLLQLAAVTLTFGLAGGAMAAQQAKTTTVTLTIDGMT